MLALLLDDHLKEEACMKYINARNILPDALVKELQDYVKRVTAPYKYPRIIEFVDELPKTISGKIRRVQIREKDQ